MSNLLQARANVTSLTQSIFITLSNLNLSEDILDKVQDLCDGLLEVTNNVTKDAVVEKIETVDTDRKAHREKKKKDAKDKKDTKDKKDVRSSTK